MKGKRRSSKEPRPFEGSTAYVCGRCKEAVVQLCSPRAIVWCSKGHRILGPERRAWEKARPC